MLKTKKSKHIIFIILLLSYVIKANSQEFKPVYDRSSISICFLKYDNRFDQNLVRSYNNIPFFNRYYINPISEPIAQWPHNLVEKNGEMLNTNDVQKRLDYTSRLLLNKDVGKQLIKTWYNYQPGIGFSLDTIFSRAKYNATSDEFDIANKTKRGEALIKDYGFNLVSESYVLFIDLRDIEKENTEGDNTIGVNFKSSIGIYVYKLKFGDDEINRFYKSWVYNTDSEDIIKNKLAAFEKMNFPFELVYSKKKHLVSGLSMASKSVVANRSIKIEQLSQQAFDGMIQEIYQSINILVSRKIEALRLKTYINHKNPIAAKNGKKESLQIDDKFGVYEYKWDDKSKKGIPKLKTIVRVKKVGDNITDINAESDYYQITLGVAKQGMVLREIPYRGVSIMAEYYPAGGFGASMFKRSKGNRTAMYGSATINFKAVPDYKIEGATLDSNAFKLGLGMAKGFQFGILELIGQVEVTVSSYLFKIENNTNYNNLYAKMSNIGVDFSVMAGINVTHFLQIYANYCFFPYYLGGYPTLYDGKTELPKELEIDMPWGEGHPFNGKPLLKIGVRYEY